MGLARIGGMADDEDRDRLTDSGQVMGTCDYMAPEQALDAHHADRRADIYSLGCTLYRLLTGHVPYRRDSLAQIILAHQQAPVPSLCQARPDVPQQLDAVFQKMVAKQPEDRYQSMTEVIAALDSVVGRGEYVDVVTETFPVGPPGNVPVSAGVGLATAAKVRVEAEVAAGDTPTQQAAVETSRQLGPATKLLVRARQKKVLTAAIGLVLVCAVAVTAFVMLRSQQPDDGQTAGNQTAGQTWEAMYGPDAPPPAIAPFDAKRAKELQEAWAKYLGVPVEMENSIGVKFMLIPPGEFDMGSTEEEVAKLLDQAKAKKQPSWYIDRLPAEAPKHRVRITKPFYLGRCEVTQAEYERVVESNPSQFKEDPTCPVEKVTWDEASAFCRKLGQLAEEQAAGAEYRLPTEAQWEYACRTGTTTKWYSGDDEGAFGEHGWFSANAGGKTHPVGQKSPNAWGLYDMHGNVWEWCRDWWGDHYYATSPMDAPPGPTGGSERVSRGGGWADVACARASDRRGCNPGDRRGSHGFRLARTVSLPDKVSQGSKKNADAPTPKPTTTTRKPTSSAPGVKTVPGTVDS
jgi:eukaryotic-like serine/threonine-protein kinase